MKHSQLVHNFTYHSPTAKKVGLHEELRVEGASLAMIINERAVDGPEKDLAIQKIEEAIMWANAGIARNDLPNSG